MQHITIVHALSCVRTEHRTGTLRALHRARRNLTIGGYSKEHKGMCAVYVNARKRVFARPMCTMRTITHTYIVLLISEKNYSLEQHSIRVRRYQ